MKKDAAALTCLITFLAISTACKARQPDEAGLLSAGDQESEQISSEGNYLIRCNSVESDAGSSDSYVFAVNGAADSADEAQPIRVSVDIIQNGATNRVVSGGQGRGTVAPGKSIFVGFESGVLTGESTDADAVANMAGVVSIVGYAEGLQVRCDIASVKLDQE